MILLIKKKYAYQSLKKIYGLNNQTIKKIIGIVGLQPNTLGIQLEQKRNSNKINELLFNMRIEFKLRLITFSRIILLIYTKSYRGMRHLQGLPCRGQRTHANGKTPKTLKTLGKNIPFRLKKKTTTILENKKPKGKKQIKKKLKLSKKQKGKLKAKQKMQKKQK